MDNKITKKKKGSKIPGKKKLWIQTAKQKMVKAGTVGKFSRAAKKEGESTLEHAKDIKSSPKSSAKLRKEAQFAINMSKLRKKK